MGKSSPVLPVALHSFIPVAAGNITFLPQIQNLFKEGNNLKKIIYFESILDVLSALSQLK